MKTRLFMMLMALFVLSNNNRVNAQEYHYDVNNDGDVNITDAILVMNYILGKDNENDKPNTSPAEAIDLGLPSGTKWASCNVGATKPEEYGGYYAWGETEEKDTYTWGTYIHSSTYHDLGKDISGSEYDVAHVKWGGNWCMPTNDDFEELKQYCNWVWEECQGVSGARVIGPNGQNIFLPAASFKDGNLNVTNYGSYWGCIWSDKAYPSELIFGTVEPSNSWRTCNFYYRAGGSAFHYCGRSVRPVIRN